MILLILSITLVLSVGLLYSRLSYWALPASMTGILAALSSAEILSGVFLIPVWSAAFLIALIFGLPALRRSLISGLVMKIMAPLLPRIGKTEQIALEAGTVWWDRDLFSGRIDWKKFLAFKPKGLSPREQAFLDGPVEELCSKLSDWDIVQNGDLPPEIWSFLKQHKFLGMIIPEEQGGLGFSALAHSAVVVKVSSRSLTAGVTIMVPNSLGPAELLHHYGTEEQKRDYLPRLASGEEVPCFALTGPEAGSDAASTQSVGIICKGTFQGQEVLGMRLNWRKRYITLGPVATVIGLAFKLHDPEHLLSETEDLGMTCALIPADLEGIQIGERHDAMGVPFHVGPNTGTDVWVPLDFIIGGPKMAGHGWRMLMERLATGRAISLPALSVAAAQVSARVVGAYGTVREQFNTPIGRFEGIEEPLSRIGGMTYLMNAARTLTAGAVDAGESPAVLSAIVKAYLTEGMRTVVNDAMDIRAGAGICRGPRNILARMYQAIPIGITVEGANILTRSMIIYGQGAIRSHPYAQDEINAVATRDLKKFDRAFFGHMGAACSNAVRAFLLGLTRGSLAGSAVSREMRGHANKISRLSAAFAVVSDTAMVTLGGKLKRKEKISGRLADALAWMYLATAAIKRYEDEGRLPYHMPFARWSATYAIYQIEQALSGILQNMPNRLVAFALRPLIFPLGVRATPPSDKLGGQVARRLLEKTEARAGITQDIYIPPQDEPGLGRLEAALAKAVDALAVETKIRDAVRAGRLEKAPGDLLLNNALAAGVITTGERDKVIAADEIRDEVIQVDSFSPAEFLNLVG
jgi:acyl-CoA dehydrogenase